MAKPFDTQDKAALRALDDDFVISADGNVVEIIIGPAGPLGAERTLREFLGSLGMDFVHIGRSDIPYRAL